MQLSSVPVWKGLDFLKRKGGGEAAGAPAASEQQQHMVGDEEVGEMMAQQAAAFEQERTELRNAAAQLQLQLSEAQRKAEQLGQAPEAQQWEQLEAQLVRAREERETAKEQIGALSEQVMDLQTRESMLKAELFSLQDTMATRVVSAPAPAATAPPGGAAGAAAEDAGKKLAAGLKGLGGKMSAFGKKKAES